MSFSISWIIFSVFAVSSLLLVDPLCSMVVPESVGLKILGSTVNLILGESLLSTEKPSFISPEYSKPVVTSIDERV